MGSKVTNDSAKKDFVDKKADKERGKNGGQGSRTKWLTRYKWPASP
jgi:hypothetical protein